MIKKYPEYKIKVPKFKEENGFYTTESRSKQMKKIRSKDTKPEKMLRKLLWDSGLRYRKNVKKMLGSPDIVMAKYKLAIFVDGEFWHGYQWDEKKKKLKSNREFWLPKIERNIQRDREVTQALEKQGWTVLRFWEYQIKKELGTCLDKILLHIDDYTFCR